MALPAAYIALAILFADKAPPSDNDDDSGGLSSICWLMDSDLQGCYGGHR